VGEGSVDAMIISPSWDEASRAAGGQLAILTLNDRGCPFAHAIDKERSPRCVTAMAGCFGECLDFAEIGGIAAERRAATVLARAHGNSRP
jgi:hypothetical protein